MLDKHPINSSITDDKIVAPGEVKNVLISKIRGYTPPLATGAEASEWLQWKIPVADIDPLSWMAIQQNPTRLYWKDRQGRFESAGVGETVKLEGYEKTNYSALFSQIQHLIANHPEIRLFGGFSFFNRAGHTSLWHPFGSYRFWVPRFELRREHNQTFFVVTARLGSRNNWSEQQSCLLDSLQQLQFDTSPTALNLPPLSCREDFPDYREWSRMVEQALELIDQGQVTKIVLARKSEFRFNNAIEPVSMLAHFHSPQARQYEFYFQPTATHAFWGISPERLYLRENRHLWSEAVAGTRPRGKSAEEDILLENELCSNEKERREHHRVMVHLRSVFHHLCNKTVESEQVTVLKLKHLQHLYWQIAGTLTPGCDDGAIMARLHPTPAVGGTPAQEALPIIIELEPFDRGWYAGPVGWIGANAAEFAVAIRSALVHRNTVYVYAGAGIVAGSVPQNEWEEIENKMAPIHKLLQG